MKSISDEEKEALEHKLHELRMMHRDLDGAIDALTEKGTYNHLQIQRLKKQKLQLKDQIARIENALVPDIIA